MNHNKRQRSVPPSTSSSKRLRLANEEEIIDRTLCLKYCSRQFGSNGPYRTVSLRCGHAFCSGCIVVLLGMTNRLLRMNCPTCEDQLSPESIIPSIFEANKVLVAANPEITDCTICMEQFTTNDRHRVVSLRCGHLFGKECVKQWLNINQTCPVCKKPAAVGEILEIFATNVVVAADPESDSIRDQLEKMEKKNKELEQQLKDGNQLEKLKQKNEELERRLKNVKDLGISIVYCNICDMPFLSKMRRRKHTRTNHVAKN